MEVKEKTAIRPFLLIMFSENFQNKEQKPNWYSLPARKYKWNMGFGMDKGDVEKDEEGLDTMKVLGENMAWLLKKIHG